MRVTVRRDDRAHLDGRAPAGPGVRATSQATVQETNCHPFRYGKWLFVHNGEIFEVEKLRRKLLFAIALGVFVQAFGYSLELHE